jgi:WD40 repeat protein
VGLLGNDVAIWEVDTGKLLHRLSGHTRGAVPFDFSSDSRRLVTGGGDGTVRVWDVVSGQELLVLQAHSAGVSGADLAPNDRYLVTTGQDDTVRIWDLEAPLRREDNQLERVRNAFYLSPNGRVALSADTDGEGSVLVAADTLEVRHRLDFTLDAAGPAFASDGQRVVGVSDLGEVQVYDVDSGALVGAYENPEGVYRYAAFVPGSHTLFAGGDDGAYLLDAETGAQLDMFPTPGAGLYGANGAFVTVSPDGRYGALHAWTADSLNVVYLWDLETGDVVFQSTPQADAVVEAFAFSTDSRLFAWGGSDNTVRLLEIRSGKEAQSLEHLNRILGIAFSADNRLLLTSTLEDSVNAWDLETGTVVRRFFASDGPAGFVAFAEGGAAVLYATAADGVIHRQSLTIDGLVDAVCARLQRDLTAVERQRYGLDERPTCP